MAPTDRPAARAHFRQAAPPTGRCSRRGAVLAAIAAIVAMALAVITAASLSDHEPASAAPVAFAQPASPTPTGPVLPPIPTVDPPLTGIPGMPGWTPPTTTTSGVPPIQIGPPTTTTAPTTTTTTPGGNLGGHDDPAWYDIPGQVKKAINDWFRDLVSSALKAVLDTMVAAVLSTPDVALFPKVVNVWSVTQGIANTIFVLLIVIGGAIVMGYETVQTRYTLKEIAPRVVFAFLAANASLSLVSRGIQIANALATAFLGQGASPQNLVTELNSNIMNQIGAAGIFLLLLALVLIVLIVILLFVWIIRVALTVVLTAAGPLALAFHATPYTEGIARLWWRAVVGLLGIQVVQALTLIVALRTFFQAADMTPGVLSAAGGVMAFLAFLVLIYIEIKIPVWVFHHVWGGGRSTLATIAKYAVLGKALGVVGMGRRSGGTGGSGRGRVVATGGGGSSDRTRVANARKAAKIPNSAFDVVALFTPLWPAESDGRGSRPNRTGSGHRRPTGAREPGRQPAAERARARAARAYSAPQADPGRAPTEHARSTRRSSASPPSLAPPATGSTPGRISSTPTPTARTPRPTGVTPARISTPAQPGASRLPRPGQVPPHPAAGAPTPPAKPPPSNS